MITLDTTRADRIGCYGYSAAATPGLDSLAARGALFERAYAQVPLTLPSHCSMMTGRYPKELGVRDNGRHVLGDSHPTLAEVFKSHGYRTAAFIATFVLDSRFGLDRGFDVYDDDMGRVTLVEGLYESQRPANVITDRGLQWLQANQQAPFFCWLHYYDPHDPYSPPAPFDKAHAHPYDGEIAFMDAQIKRVLDWLEEAGVAERTLVVAVGDHGESLGEHGIDGHAVFLYEDVLRVPMIIAHPVAVPASQKISEVVEVADLFATLHDLFGWQPPPDLMTRSVADAFRGKTIRDGEAYSESLYALNVQEWAEQRSLTARRWKYISSTKPELFDVVADPGELVNQMGRETSVAAELLAKLKERYESMPAGETTELVLDATAKKALGDLGYAQSKSSLPEQFLTPGLPDPKDMISYLSEMGRARLLMIEGRFADALHIWERAARTNARSNEIAGNLGTCYLKVGELEKAEAVFRRILESEPDNDLALIGMGDLLVDADRLDDAIRHYEVAAGILVPNPQVFTKLGDTLVRAKRSEEAVAFYRETIQRFPEFPAIHGRLGALLGEQGQLDEAIVHLQFAVTAEPNNHWAVKNLFIILLQAGRVAEATPYLHQVVEANPGLAEGVLATGRDYLKQGKGGQAKALLEAATNVEPISVRAMFYLGQALGAEGDAGAANQWMERAIAKDPTFRPAVEHLIGYYLQSQQVTDAVRVLRLGAERIGDAKMINLLATLLASSQDDKVRNGQEARTLAMKLVQTTPGPQPVYLATLAAAMAECGEFDEATAKAQQALESAEKTGNSNLAESIRSQLDQYQAGKPFRHPQF